MEAQKAYSGAGSPSSSPAALGESIALACRYTGKSFYLVNIIYVEKRSINAAFFTIFVSCVDSVTVHLA
jgi:hypothetical protein